MFLFIRIGRQTEDGGAMPVALHNKRPLRVCGFESSQQLYDRC